MAAKAGASPRVMIVDDHALVREAVRRALAGSGIDVVAEASSAQEAIDRVGAARPDLVLLDVDLRGTSGTEIVAELRRRAPTTRVVMLTVSTDEDDVDTAIAEGASGYLTKDIGSDALLRAVRGALVGDLAMSRRMAQQLVDRMGRTEHRAGSDEALNGLTNREREILRLMSDGLTAREIGETLVLSPRTVEGHIGNIMRKLGARNRVEAVRVFRGR